MMLTKRHLFIATSFVFLLAACGPKTAILFDQSTISEDQAAISDNIFSRATLIDEWDLVGTLPYFAEDAEITATTTGGQKHTFTKDEYLEFATTFKEARYRELKLRLKRCEIVRIDVDNDTATAEYRLAVKHRYGSSKMRHLEEFRKVDGVWLMVENTFSTI